MSQAKTDEVTYWKNTVSDLQTALEGANENGLLKNDAAKYKSIMDKIVSALNDLSATPPKTNDARSTYSQALQEFNDYVNSAPMEWRFNYFYAWPALIYLIALFAAILISWGLDQTAILNLNILWIPSYAFIWGALGGVVYGFWWLWQNVNKRKFRKSWYP